MPVDILGSRLRARRTELSQTLAWVAERAGLSVPYVANLERGRGNPTLDAIESLAHALDLEPADLLQSDRPPTPPPEPAGLADFTTSRRFRRETSRLAKQTRRPRNDVERRLESALRAVALASPQQLTDLNWHRTLDCLTLVFDPDR